jgi:hypothetical protein
VPPVAGRRGCGEAVGDRVETRPWERGEMRREGEATYIFLTKARSRFYCGSTGPTRDVDVLLS